MNKEKFLAQASLLRQKEEEQLSTILKLIREEMTDMFDADEFIDLCNVFQGLITKGHEAERFTEFLDSNLKYNERNPAPPNLTKLLRLSKIHIHALIDLWNQFAYLSDEDDVGAHTFLVKNGMISSCATT